MLKQKIYIFLTNFFGYLKKNRIIEPKSDLVKVNLGSGLTVAPGWINIDADFNVLMSGMPKFIKRYIYKKTGAKNWYTEQQFLDTLEKNTFYHHRIDYGIPFHDNSIDFIFTSHFLEHVYREDAVKILEDSLRALKPGGIIRVSIPDLDIAIEMVREGKYNEGLELFFVDSKSDQYSKHHYLYNFEMMRKIMTDIGYTDVIKCNFQEGRTPDINILDCREDVTLFLEAKKPE